MRSCHAKRLTGGPEVRRVKLCMGYRMILRGWSWSGGSWSGESGNAEFGISWIGLCEITISECQAAAKYPRPRSDSSHKVFRRRALTADLAAFCASRPSPLVRAACDIQLRQPQPTCQKLLKDPAGNLQRAHGKPARCKDSESGMPH